MAKTQVQVTFEDWRGKSSTFGFLIDSTYAVAPHTELRTALNALRAASDCKIVKVTLSDVLDLTGLANPAAVNTNSNSVINEQAVMSYRSLIGTDVKLSVPGPLDALFTASGGYADQDIDETATEVANLNAALLGVGLMDRSENLVFFRKGWRRGQPHS
jgi:hypothetical protein